MRHTITDPLNRELEARMQERLANDQPIAGPVEAAPPVGEPAVPDVPVVPVDPSRTQPLEEMHREMLQAHRKMRNLSSELTRRKLTESQLKDLGVTEDWLYVTKGIAKQYGEALIQMERTLNQLHEQVTAFRAEFGKDPEFLSE